MSVPALSVVIPVFNEEAVLPSLLGRLLPVLGTLDRTSEIVFVDDGSTDNSLSVLKRLGQTAGRPVTVVELNRNVGQYTALTAALREARGAIVVVLDADLQNPPEEIVSLLAKIEAGHDVVTGYRLHRRDNWFRKSLSALMNKVRGKLTSLRLRDHGCMLAAYRRGILDQVLSERDTRTFLPGVAAFYACNPAEVPVKHEHRAAGVSKYTVTRLFKSAYEVVVSFSMTPFQLLPAAAAGLLVLGLGCIIMGWAVSRELWGSALAALNLLLLCVTLVVLGLIGEYLVRIHRMLTGRPSYVIRNVYRLGQP
jgi:undecaprenyl-phosphate 4-deoxy-4-formamido-L-arabinose transferase